MNSKMSFVVTAVTPEPSTKPGKCPFLNTESEWMAMWVK